MFRFKQKLATILGDRKLSSSERAGLDAYDIELEDALSTTSSGGDSLWQVSGGYLFPLTDPQGFLVVADGANVLLSTTVGNIDLQTVTSGRIFINAVEYIFLEAATYIQLTATDNIIMDSLTGNIVMANLPTSDPGVSGALYTVLGVLHVSP